MYSVYNLLTLGKDGQILKNCEKEIAKKIKNSIYLGYLAHIEFRLYENLSASDVRYGLFSRKIRIDFD